MTDLKEQILDGIDSFGAELIYLARTIFIISDGGLVGFLLLGQTHSLLFWRIPIACSIVMALLGWACVTIYELCTRKLRG